MKVDVKRPSFDCLFEPKRDKLLQLGLLAATSVGKCVNSSVPVRFLNSNYEKVDLNKNLSIGCLSELDISQNKSTKDELIKENYNHLDEILSSIKENRNLNNVQKERTLNLIKKYSKLFSAHNHDIGFCPQVEHEIQIKEHAPCQQIPSKVPIHVEKWVDDQVDDLLKKGIIQESNSPWSAPIVVVKKKSGDFRLCIDYRRLNAVTIKPIYHIPDSRTIFDTLNGSKIFSSIDISSAYYQCPVKEEHKKYTSFTTRKGQYEFNRMPFGLSGAPFTFQRLMNTIFRKENWQICLIYLDDILIFSENIDEHIIRLKKIMEILLHSGIKLGPKKCSFFMTELCYLGHKISAEGIQADPSKIEVLKNWPVPKTVHDLRSFLGFCNYYRRFVKNYSELSKNLEQLIKGKDLSKLKVLCWTDIHQIAFKELIKQLCESPCLSYPREDCTYILDCDASSNTIGAVLSQIQDGSERVIAYGSKKLSNSEVRYCITRKELLAVYYFITHYKHYLLGKRFIVRTDHKALSWLLNWEKPSTSQYCTWIAELEIFDFEIQHRAGKEHVNADFMSRPCMQCNLNHKNPQPKRNVKVFKLSEEDDSTSSQWKAFCKIRRAHNDLGHIGMTKLKSIFEISNLSLPNLDKNIHKVISDCLYCQERKAKGHVQKKSNLCSTANLPFDSVMIDIAGPMPKTKDGNMYLLAIIDIFTRFIKLVPLRSINTENVIESLTKEWIPHFGFPNKLYSDCGTNFKSSKMITFCQSKGITQIFSSPYHHQSNGIVERYFRTTKDMIYASSRTERTDWDKVIPMIELGLRSSKTSPLNKSPFEVMYGFNPRVMPFKIENPTIEFENKRNKIQKSVKKYFKTIEEENEKKINHFNVNEKVMVEILGKKPNVYERRYFGPCKILEVVNPNSYILEFQGKLFRRNADALKRYNGNSKKQSTIEPNSTLASTSIISLQDRIHSNNFRYPTRNRRNVQRYGFTSSAEGDVQ